MLAFNSAVEPEIFTEGITQINKIDLKYAKEMGYTIKLLGIAKKENSSVTLRVHPTMIPLSHELATVRDELNAIYLVGANTGKMMLYGAGAGQMPTATVVVSDIVNPASQVSLFDNISVTSSIWSCTGANLLNNQVISQQRGIPPLLFASGANDE